MEKTTIGILLVIVASMFWGVGNVFVRAGLQSIKASSGAVLALAGALIVTLLIAVVSEFEALFSVSWIALVWFAIIGIFHFALGRFFLYQGIRYIGAARGTSIANSYPLFAVIFAFLFFEENMNVLIIVGTLSIVGGLYLLLSENIESSLTTKKGRLLGYAFGLGAAICWAAISVLIRYHAAQYSPPIIIVTFSLLSGLVTLLAVTGKKFEIGIKTNKKAIILILLAGGLSGVAAASYYAALTMAPVVVVAPISATNPLITIICVHLFLKRMEQVTRQVVIGSLLVVFGAWLTTMN